MANTITVWIGEDDTAPYTVNAESEMESMFDEMLDDVYGTVKVAGFEYDTSRALKELDPIAWRQGFLNYCDSGWTELEMPTDLYLSGDGDAIDEWIAAQD